MDYDMYMEILNRLDTLNTKIDICCGNYDKAAENIQRTYRGFTSRRNTRRTMKPNITESLLNMPGDISQMITNRVSELKHNEMPITDIIVPTGKYEGQYLHDALFSILNSDREYNILPWTQRVLLGEDAKLFSEEYKKWYFNTYKKGGKKRNKTKKKRKKLTKK